METWGNESQDIEVAECSIGLTHCAILGRSAPRSLVNAVEWSASSHLKGLVNYLERSC